MKKLAITLIALAAIVPAAAETLILDQTGYFRSYYRFERDMIDARALREQGEEIFGARALQRMRTAVMRGLEEGSTADDAEFDWMEHVEAAYQLTVSRQSVRRERNMQSLGAHPPAAENWYDFDFDDHAWRRNRTPMQMGWIGMNMDGLGGIRDAHPHIHTSYFRGHFHVEDVRRDAPLTLSMQFRGGVRVFINGHEIARSHLPEGKLASETLAEAYPLEAYVLKPEELDEEARKNLPDRRNNARDHFLELFLARDLPVSYDEAAALAREGEEPYLPREAWERIYQARERRLENVTIPANMLRQGRNVIAIELRSAPIHPVIMHEAGIPRPRIGNWQPYDWFAHSRIKRLTLTSNSADAVTALERPAGMQVWVPDMHERIFSPDFREPGSPAEEIRISGARNGTFGAKLAVGSDRKLDDFSIEISELTHADGRNGIDASRIEIFGSSPRRADSIMHLGAERTRRNRHVATTEIVPRRYGKPTTAINHLDELTDDLFESVPADHAMVAWLSLRIPDNAPPGEYTGIVTVSAGGVEPVEVPIKVSVAQWRVPEPSEFTTVSGFTVNPYRLYDLYLLCSCLSEARSRCHHLPRDRYIPNLPTGEEGWYEERHLELIRRSSEMLARIGGGDWLDVRVLSNPNDIVWIRQPDGSLSFDFTNLNRLLDAVVDAGGIPKIISFNIMYPSGDGYTAKVPVRNHDGDEIEWVELGFGADPALRRDYWGQFANALYDFMLSKEMQESMYWGMPWDCEGDRGLVSLMASILPQVRWIRTSHNFMPDPYYTVTSTCVGPHMIDLGARPPRLSTLDSMLGWSEDKYCRLVNTRRGSLHYMDGAEPPFPYRAMPERCLVAGYQGIGLFYADGGTPDGMAIPFSNTRGPGLGIDMLFWPGRNGMNSSPRVEALLEGMQEAEARVFIERALLENLIPEPLADYAIDLLNDRVTAMEYLPMQYQAAREAQLYGIYQGWQSRSEALYQLAARVADYVGLQLDSMEVDISLLSRTSIDIPLRIANSGGAGRAWQARSDNPKIAVSANEGRTETVDTLLLSIDGKDALPGNMIDGTVIFEDLSTGRKHQIAIIARVIPALELVRSTDNIFAAVGLQRNVNMRLVNHTDSPIRWNAELRPAWLQLEPKSGVLPGGGVTRVCLSAYPPEQVQGGAIQSEVRFIDEEGRSVSTAALTVYVESAETVVPGEAEPIHLAELADRIAQHWSGTPMLEGTDIRAEPPGRLAPRVFTPADIDEIVYDIAGSGFDTFATAVRYTHRQEDQNGRARFQVITDGQVRFDTGWITPGDETISVIVPYLREARRLTLLFTRENPMANDFGNGLWVEPRFYPAEK